MRLTFIFFFFLLFKLSVFSQNESIEYIGTIGEFGIHMELMNQNDSIVGWYEYPGKSVKLRISGTINQNGSIELFEFLPNGKQTGYFIGKYNGVDGFDGVWNNPSRSKILNFVISSINHNNLISNQEFLLQDSKVKGFSKLALWSLILLLLGLVYLIYYIVKKKKKFEVKIEKKTGQKPSEKVNINKENLEVKEDVSNLDTYAKGKLFEDYIVQKFHSEKLYKLKEWRGDKYLNGIYPESNKYPDLELEFNIKDIKRRFAIECKFRTKLFDQKIEIATFNQFERYKEFEVESKIPVYILLGFGGVPNNPNKLFLIPLKKINKTYFSLEELKQYSKEMDSHFYYNLIDESLN